MFSALSCLYYDVINNTNRWLLNVKLFGSYHLLFAGYTSDRIASNSDRTPIKMYKGVTFYIQKDDQKVKDLASLIKLN